MTSATRFGVLDNGRPENSADRASDLPPENPINRYNPVAEAVALLAEGLAKAA